jgi:glycosyltransferase involved in cell wall biosynthesis
MKVLFLVYSPQKSFANFTEKLQTNFPWVDAMINELTHKNEITIGIVVPIRDAKFQKKTSVDFSIYGVPDLVVPRSLFGHRPKKVPLSQQPVIFTYILEVITDFNPDIIQVFGTENIFGMVQLYTKVPMVIHLQGSILVVTTKWFTGLTRWEQFRELSLRKIVYKYGNFLEYFTFKERGQREEIIMKNCKYYIGRTSFDRKLTRLFSPEASYFSCQEFIREDFFKHKWEAPLTNTITCFSILKGVTYKGIDLLLDTFAMLDRYTSMKIDFKICGVSEHEEVVSILKKRNYGTNIWSHFKFLGKLDTMSLINELTTSHFYIHPSYMENSSNSICEAMALGMPVIATNAGGTNSLITDDLDGILVQEGDPYSMAAAIIELYTNYQKAITIGNNARERAIQRHQPSKLGEEMVSIYKNVISTREMS